MRRHLNTLYVTTPDAWLHKDGENVVVKRDGAESGRIPIHILGSIVCFGAAGVTPALMGHCAKKGVAMSFLGRYGRFMSRVEGPVSGNVLLRRAQYRVADEPHKSLALARHNVIGKLVNQRAVVRRALRDHREKIGPSAVKRLGDSEQAISSALRGAQSTTAMEGLRGDEGQAARSYFGAFADMVLSDDDAFEFSHRSRRPPLDPVNALLSFFYTLLTHDYRSALESVGLDPCVGFLHADRPGRPSLALDLMEEMRSVLADRLALSLINRRQVLGRDFTTAISGGVVLQEEARKKVLAAYQDRKQSELIHPFLKEKTTLGLVPFLQATLLARYLRNELDAYPPFVWK